MGEQHTPEPRTPQDADVASRVAGIPEINPQESTLKRSWRFVFVIVFVIAAVVCLVPMVLYWVYAPATTAYENSRVIAASLSTGIAAFVALVALVQYRRNSHDKRVERSMSFWERSNTRAFTDNLRKFVAYWVDLAANKQGKPPNFRDIAMEDSGHLDAKLAIEHVLDFYDEACGAVMMGACDEAAMYFYLGPLMIRHTEKLRDFIEAWQKKYRRPEKWDCLLFMAKRWKESPPRCLLPSPSFPLSSENLPPTG